MNQPQSFSPESKIQTATGFALTCAGLFLLVVGITVVAAFSFPADGENSEHLVAEFSGVDDGQTGSFQVDDHWEFRWEHDGHLQRIVWRRPDGYEDLFLEMPGKPIRHHGSVNNEQGGEYTIKVEGEGNWTIQVYQF